jgi:GNAT superfamily N-acetyltransferase
MIGFSRSEQVGTEDVLCIREIDYACDYGPLRRMLGDRDAFRLGLVPLAVEAGDAFVLVAELNGEAVGYVTVHLAWRDDQEWQPGGGTETFMTGENAYLEVIEVREDLRGRGIGRALLAAAERLAGERGKAALWLHTGEANVGAQRLYEREGWTHTETVAPAWNDGRPMQIYRRAIARSASTAP